MPQGIFNGWKTTERARNFGGKASKRYEKPPPHLNIKDVHTKTPIKDLMFYYYVFLRFWQDGILGFSQKASKKAT